MGRMAIGALPALALLGLALHLPRQGVHPAETRASRLPQLAHGSPPPAGTTWQMSAAGACTVPFSDQVDIRPEASLRYDGATPADVLLDAATYGAQWRMAAVADDGRSIKAITVWCTPPLPLAEPASATAADRPLRRCWCGGEPNAVGDGERFNNNSNETRQGEQL